MNTLVPIRNAPAPVVEADPEDEMQVVVLGRSLGTATGWDQVDDSVLFFYEFKTDIECLKPFEGGLCYNYQTGYFSNIDDENKMDIIDLLKNILRR